MDKEVSKTEWLAEQSGRQDDEAPALDPVTEELVAYLDGELSDQEIATVERRLAEETEYRDRLTRLQQTWDLLDALPQAEVTEGFTRSTVEMVAIAAEQEVQTQTALKIRRRWGAWLAATAACGLCGVIGFALVQYRMNAENRQLLRDLPVIERIDLYREVGDIDFLEQLAEARLFDEEVDDGP